jgi:hypothetical protein
VLAARWGCGAALPENLQFRVNPGPVSLGQIEKDAPMEWSTIINLTVAAVLFLTLIASRRWRDE